MSERQTVPTEDTFHSTAATRRYPKYYNYTLAETQFLDELPSHWCLTRIKRLGEIRYGLGEPPARKEDGLPFLRATDIHRGKIDGSAVVSVDPADVPWRRAVVLRAGDILVVRSGAYTGDSAIIPHNWQGAIAGYDMVLRLHKTHSPFIAFALLSTYLLQGQIHTTRMRAAQPHLNADELGSFLISIPPLPEQRTIAAFLDRETQKIDALIAKKERLIELLQEKRTAMISQAVTKGLDPNVEMKDSGVEWLGQIPQHWNVVAYKRVCTRVDVGIAEAATHAYCHDGVPIIRSTNVKPNKLDTSEVLRIEPWFAVKNRSKTLRAGDLVTVRTGYPGTTAIVPVEFDGCQCFTLVLSTPKRTVHGPFFSWFMNSNPGVSYFEMEGWGTAQTNISVPIVRFMPVPLPPLPEQTAINAYLHMQAARLDALVGKVSEAVKRLHEYRTALISAAVTGKIDVRKEVPADDN